MQSNANTTQPSNILLVSTKTTGDTKLAIQTNKPINPIIANFAEMSDDSFIRPNDCAQLMSISIATFWRLVASGKLKTHKLTERTTTVRAGDLRNFINTQKGGL